MGKIAGKISLIEARLQKLNQKDDYTEQLFIVTPLIIFFLIPVITKQSNVEF